MSISQTLDSLQQSILKDFKEVHKDEPYHIIGETSLHYINDEEIYIELKVVPQQEGVYFIKQVFQYRDGWGYKNNSLLNILKVGAKGSSRRFSNLVPDRHYSNTSCIGDTIIIPVFWNKHMIATQFAIEEDRVKNIYGEIHPPVERPPSPNAWKINNEVPEIKVLQIHSYRIVGHRVHDYSVRHSIELEAIKPGSFTLSIGEVKRNIVIHPNDEALTLVITQPTGRQWEGNGSSGSLPYEYRKSRYITDYAELRVGDTITLNLMSYKESPGFTYALDLNLNIRKQPFTL